MKHQYYFILLLLAFSCSEPANPDNVFENDTQTISSPKTTPIQDLNLSLKIHEDLLSHYSKDELRFLDISLSFLRDGSVWLVNSNGVQEIVEGFNPYLSPNGKILAYTSINDEKRVIRLFDIENSKSEVLNVDDNNYYGPVWSPNGEYIAFNIMNDGMWQIGIINSNNEGYRLFEIKKEQGIGLHSPTWTNDSKFLIAHDMFTAYKFNPVSGVIEDTIDLNIIATEEFGISSSSNLLISKDNSTMIFDAGMYNESMKGVHGPPYAILAFNFKTKKIKRLSPKNMYTSEPWIDKNDQIYFSGVSETGFSSIYKTDIEGSYLTKVIDNGYSATGTR